MKRVLPFAALGAVLLLGFGGVVSPAFAQKSSSSKIVGRWRSMRTSKGGIGTVFEFYPDGSVDFSVAVNVETPWRMENKQLVLPPPSQGAPEIKYTLEWDGDDKVELTTEGVTTELTRVGKRAEAGDPLLGEWIEFREMAGHSLEAHWLIFPKGRMLFVMPLRMQRGTYTVSGSVIHFNVTDLKPEVRFKVKGNVLRIAAGKDDEGSGFVRY